MELVEDHCHWSGDFRGCACLSCNTKMREPQYIPVFFHSGGGFDFHFIIRAIAEISKKAAGEDPHEHLTIKELESDDEVEPIEGVDYPELSNTEKSR